MELDVERKRKRTYSGGATLTAQHVKENLHRYGEKILHCIVNITRGIRECGNTIVLKYVCGLLNSGGGILHMRNIDAERGVVLSKHLDTWWSGMEIKMAEILSRDDICNYFDLVGNHDDHDLFLFVKTAEHLCTLSYHCRLPTDTATHDVTYQSLMRLLVGHHEPGSLLDLPPVPDRYVFGRCAQELKKETKQIQFKQLSSNDKSKAKSTLPERVCGLMVKYVSAFANHEGGHIYFGIGDTRANVIGEEMNLRQQRDLEMLIGNRMRLVIWRDMNIVTKRGVHWDINFYPVENSPKNSQRVVVVVSVVKFPGGVYTHCPVSTYVDGTGALKEFTFSQWRDAVLNPLRDVPELHHRFEKLSLLVPRAPLVFSLPNTISSIINKCILGSRDEIQPRLYIESFAKPVHREAIKTVLGYFKGNNSVVLGLECWGLKIPMLESEDIVCDVLVMNEANGVLVLTLATSVTPDVRQHAQIAATTLKNRLTQNGGCVLKLAVIACVVNVNEQNILEHLQQELSTRDIYPSHFLTNKTKFQSILHATAITMGAYMAKSQVLTPTSQVGRYYFLLTHDQFELLWTQQFTRELWIHGPAGAGKTVAAIQMMQELCRRGCSPHNILYLAENENLVNFVSNHNVCIVSTRRELLADNEHPDAMGRKYSQVCNVIVDEAQNFKDRDGDWYALAEKLASRPPSEQLRRCSNYFWIFMDYSQKVHKFQAGLPSVVGKNNFMLSEVSRSTREIFDFTSRLMMASENVEGLMSPTTQTLQRSVTPKLAHHFSSGKGVDIMSCKDSEISGLLNQVLSGLLESGVRTEDIAILVGKQKELDQLQPRLSELSAQMPTSVSQTLLQDIPTRRSVEEHLQKCGSDRSVGHRSSSRDKTVPEDGPATDGPSESAPSRCYMDDLEEVSSDDELELTNPFDILAEQDSDADSALGGSKGSLTQDDATGETGNADLKMEDDQIVQVRELKSSAEMMNSVVDGSGSSVRGEASSSSRDSISSRGEGAVKFYHGEGSREASMDRDSMRSERGEYPWSRQNSTALDTDHIAIDTVRRFSGLDKTAVIGVNPYVNEEHADFKKFLLSLATRAKDNLVIITTSDSIKKQLEKLVS